MTFLPNPFDAPILYKETTGSTMDDARRAAREGFPPGTVCAAGHQESGKGRLPGRRWIDGSGDSLLFTLVLARSAVPGRLPLTQLAALALCRRLETGYALEPRIKWPNDVVVGGAKIAGILVEAESGIYLAGMGINRTQAAFPEGLRSPATSIAAAAGRSEPVAVELAACLAALKAVIAEAPGPGEIARRLVGLGGPVSVLLGLPESRQRLTGILAGIGDDGALLVRGTDGAVVPVYSGEIEKS